MVEITMFSARGCGYCHSAENLLKRHGVAHINKILVDEDPVQFDAMKARTGRRTVPQIYIGELHVGGFDDLSALERSGRLEEMLR